MRHWLPLFLLVIQGTTAALHGADRPVAPPVSLPDERGTVRHLSDFAGQVVLIDFWASWCVPCKASFPALDALHKEFQSRGFTVLAINVDEQRRAADAFLAARPHVMPVLMDPTGAAAQAFAVKAMPSSALIDRHGVIRFVHAGYSEKTLAEYRLELTTLLGEHAP